MIRRLALIVLASPVVVQAWWTLMNLTRLRGAHVAHDPIYKRDRS